MLIKYYDLKDYKKLPPDAVYIDPQNSKKYYPKKDQSLEDFAKAILADQTLNNQPTLEEEDFKVFLIASLYESSSKKSNEEYFVGKAKLPEFAQIWDLAKATAYEIHKKEVISIAQRRERALKCLGCTAFHRTKNQGLSGFAKKLVTKVVDKVKKTSLKDSLESQEYNTLGSCGACGCDLKNKTKYSNVGALIALKVEDLDRMLKVWGHRAFDNCWILNEAIKNPEQKKMLLPKLKAGNANGPQLLDLNIEHKVKNQLNGKK
jgi:hypothetical protein